MGRYLCVSNSQLSGFLYSRVKEAIKFRHNTKVENITGRDTNDDRSDSMKS